jgi:hypothetical protein
LLLFHGGKVDARGVGRGENRKIRPLCPARSDTNRKRDESRPFYASSTIFFSLAFTSHPKSLMNLSINSDVDRERALSACAFTNGSLPTARDSISSFSPAIFLLYFRVSTQLY